MNSKQLWQHSPSNQQNLNDFETSLFTGTPYMSIPLASKQGVLGLINIASSNPTRVDIDALEAITGIADITATALQSQWHREAFDDAQDAIITALAKLSEYRDPETGAHLLRLKKYSALICQALAKTDKYRLGDRRIHL